MAPELALALTGLTMGLLGGPHCVAMCTAPCALALGRDGMPLGPPAEGLPITGPRAATPAPARGRPWRWAAFHLGRLIGYSALGLAVASSMEALGWMTRQAAVMRPVWTLFHAFALVLGLMLLVLARQPVALDAGARRVWARVRRQTPADGAVGAVGGVSHGAAVARAGLVGAAWALMPCGLLYSALLVAAVSGQAQRGVLVMAAFALGTMAWLAAGPWLLGLLRRARGDGFGVRVGGGVLALASGAALWLGFMHDMAPWCTLPP